MTESEMYRMVRQVIKNELAQIAMASINVNDSALRSSVKRSPDDGPMLNLRSIQPFGISSRAPAGTDCFVSPINGDITHLVVNGHFDANKPSLNDGEAILYGADGQVIYMKSGGSIHQGSKTSSEPVVLGNVLKTTLTNILNAFLQAPQIGFDGMGLPVVLDPGVAENLTNELNNHLNDASQNILSQKNFVERGA